MSPSQPDRGSTGEPGQERTIEIGHRRHRDHPSWDIPQVPGDLFPLREAALLAHSAHHGPICAVVQGLSPGDHARVHSDHPVGPLCHAIDHRCGALVSWEVERDGPDEWVVVLTRR